VISAMLNGLCLAFSERLKKTFPLKVVAAPLWGKKKKQQTHSEIKAAGIM